MAFTGLPPRPADSKRRTWVFNPPPNWPAPPAGWQPPPHWHPDPSWPAAPADWEFWKPAPRRGQRGTSFYIKAVAGVLTFAAAMIGVYVGIKSLPQQQTTGNWVSQANAACNQDNGALNLSLNNALAPFMAGQSSSAAPPSLVGTLSGLVAAEGSLGKLIGDLGALKTPQDDRAPEVQAVLSSGNAVVDSLGALSSVVQNAALKHNINAQVITEVSNAGKHLLATLVLWQKAIGALGLTRCPFWTRNPGVTPTLPQPTLPVPPLPSPTATLSGAEQQLVNLLAPTDMTGCTGRPELEVNGITAAVNCQTVLAGPTKRPLVVQFSDVGSAQAWFSSYTTGFVDRNDCASGFRLGTWTHNNVAAGPLGCSYMANGGFRMVWVIDNSLIGVIAEGSDGPTMYAWWTKSADVAPGAG